MSEPPTPRDALFGPDGTQLPDPLPVFPDPLTGPEVGAGQDRPAALPVPPPPVLDLTAMREAIDAAIAEDLAEDSGPPPGPRVPTPRGPAGAVPVSPPEGPTRLRELIRRELPAGPSRARSGGGGRVGCVIVLIIFGVLAVNVVAGLVESLSALLP